MLRIYATRIIIYNILLLQPQVKSHAVLSRPLASFVLSGGRSIFLRAPQVAIVSLIRII